MKTMRGLMLALILSWVAVGCSDDAPSAVAPNVTPQQQADASRSMGLAFPPETQYLLYHRMSGGPDDAVYLKIQLPTNALTTFLAQTPLASVPWRTDRNFVDDMPHWPQWQPSRIKKYRSAQIRLPNAESLNVLIDEDRDEPKVVYLMWFQT